MVYSSRDWRRSASGQIGSTVDNIRLELMSQCTTVRHKTNEFNFEAAQENPDIDYVEELANELIEELRKLGEDSFRNAGDVNKLKTWAIRRGLRGEEPIGYSTPDGGGKYDMYHGMKTQQNMLAREVTWPLNIGGDKWERETGRPTKDGYEPITGEGTKKYTRQVGQMTVTVLIDERGAEPI